ncbi:MAG: YigZ family protein [Candidatus Delongbacteria bacterium]|nr:YigZ family protein [Candidatus Delongbacteria bacterium]
MLEYITVGSDYRYEETIRKSRFIARLFPVRNESDAVQMLTRIRKEDYQATHHCWAYHLIAEPAPIIQYSDDGEPARTAGYPISQVLSGQGFYQVLLVVTRYFGGIKLGTGGLIKAYTTSAQGVIAKAVPVIHRRMVQLELVFDHPQTGVVMHLVKEFHLKIINQDYNQQVFFLILCRPDQVDHVTRACLDQTAGTLRPKVGDSVWIPVPAAE